MIRWAPFGRAAAGLVWLRRAPANHAHTAHARPVLLTEVSASMADRSWTLRVAA
jgi:hypothetical protein